MWKKILAGIVCLLLFATAASTALMAPDYYSADRPTDPLITALKPEKAFQRAEAYADMMRRQDIPALQRESDPSILNDGFYKAVPQIAEYSTDEKPTAVRILGYNVSVFKGTAGSWKTKYIVIAHHYPDKVIITTTWFKEQGRSDTITGFNLRRLSNDDVKSLRFSLEGKQPVHYAVLTLACAILVFSLVTLYVALTRPRVAWRWAWVIFVAFGIGHFTFNWGDATLAFDLANFHAPQATFEQLLLEPAKLHFWLPIGAVLFWFLSRQKPAPQARPHPEF